MAKYQMNQRVEWNWGNGKGNGKVNKIYEEKITLTIDGTEVTRNATRDNPAYLLKQDDGDEVLKSETELASVEN